MSGDGSYGDWLVGNAFRLGCMALALTMAFNIRVSGVFLGTPPNLQFVRVSGGPSTLPTLVHISKPVPNILMPLQ
jgi:hypothetical protein